MSGFESSQSLVEYGWRRVIIVVAVMLASLMQTLDSTIVVVTLPYIQGNLGATIDQVTWVSTGFIIANVVVIPITPWISRRLGRKQYFTISIVGFTIASMLCGIAGSFNELVIFRVLQGAFGGGLLAVAQPILRETFPPEQLGLSQSLFTIGALFGPALGPWVGGILTDQLDWRWVFFINIVPGIAAAILVMIFMRNPAPPQRIVGDPVGIGLLTLGVFSLQYVLDEGERNYWFSDPLILTFTITAVLGLVGFVVWELRGTRNPIVNLRIFANRAVSIGSAIAITLGLPVFGAALIIPQYATNVLGYTATLSGDLLLVRAVPVALLTPVIGILIQSGRVQPRYVLLAGAALTGIGSVWLSFLTTSDTPFDAMVPALILQGIGQGALFVPLLVAVVGAVKMQDSSEASAFINLFFQLGGSLASALLVVILNRRQDLHLDKLGGMVTQTNPLIASYGRAAGKPSDAVLTEIANLITQQAAAFSYADVFLVVGVGTLITVPLIISMPRTKTTEVKIEVG
jgi:MFS transporter, DHA2 family, multidrug resistance protein